MKRIKIFIELNVPDNITENMVAAAYESEDDRLAEFLQEELGDDGEVYVALSTVLEL